MSDNATGTAATIGLGLAGFGLGSLLAPAFGGIIGGMIPGLGYMGGSFLGSMLFGPKPENSMPPMSHYPIQSSSKGPPVPVMYGTARMAGNVIWMGPLHTYKIEQDSGKGGGDAPSQTGYYRSFCIAICEGERNVLRIWKGKDEIAIGVSLSQEKIAIIVGQGGIQQEITVFPGDGTNDGLADLIGEDFADYKHTLCVFFESWDLGVTDMLPNFTFEVSQDVPIGFLIGGNDTSFFLGTDYSEQAALTSTSFPAKVAFDPVNVRFITGGAVGGSPIVNLFDEDGAAIDITWETPAGGFGAACTVMGLQFSADGDYIFIYTVNPMRLYKYQVSDGSLVWQKDPTDDGNYTLAAAYSFAVDSLDQCYVFHVRNDDTLKYGIMVYDSDGTLIAFILSTSSGGYQYGAIRSSWLREDGYSLDDQGENQVMGQLAYTGQRSAGYPSILALLDLPENTTKITQWDDVAYADTGWVVVWIKPYWYTAVRIASMDNGKGIVVCDTDGTEIQRKSWEDELSTFLTMCNGPAHTLLVFGNDASGDPYLWTYDSDLTLLSVQALDLSNSFTWTTYQAQAIYAVAGGTGRDANPADIIYDIMTHTRYGARAPQARINLPSFDTIRGYCDTNDLLISPIFDSARPVLDWVQFVCAHFGGFMYVVGNQYYLGAWRAEDAEFDITRADLVVEGDEPPVKVQKRKYSESRNHIEISWLSRDDLYGPAVTPAKDDVDIRHSGRTRKQQVQLSGITRSVLAQKMAYRYLIDSMYRFSTYSFQISYRKSLVHVAKVALLSDGFKIASQRVRIINIEESKDGRNLQVEAVDDISDHYPDLSTYALPEVTKREPDTGIADSDLADPIVTTRESWDEATIYVSLAPTNAYVDGWHIYLSRDGITYTLMETVTITAVTGGSANSAGTLLSALPGERAIIWRPSQRFTVDIGTVTDLRTDITDQQFFNNLRLAKIGNEIVAYKTCAEQATEGQWKVTTLIRGLFQTEPVAHPIGETFRTLDINYTASFLPSDIGKTLYIKAVPFYGAVSGSLATTDPVEVVVQGNYDRPFGASVVRLTANEEDGGYQHYSGASFTLYWNLPGRSSGWNVGGYDGGGTWQYGDDESLLVPQSGVAYGAYQQDPDLQGVDLVFRQADGTYIGQKNLGVVSQATITKATDLGGNNPARIDVLPRYARRASRAETAIVDDGS